MFKFPHESEVCPSGETGEQMEDFDAQSTVLPLSFAFCCQACKEADAKSATLAFSSQTHFWKAASVSHLPDHTVTMALWSF